VLPAPRVTAVLLRIFTTNDFHGAVEPRVHAWSAGRPIGGAAAMAGWMDSSAVACACPVLRVDGGDQMQGTLQSNLVYRSLEYRGRRSTRWAWTRR
jgi:2',3'-cyclic-nucleotide 2'-phosphodiesterase (5'-nucleotidase family)